jgi:hypothetical protein
MIYIALIALSLGVATIVAALLYFARANYTAGKNAQIVADQSKVLSDVSHAAKISEDVAAMSDNAVGTGLQEFTRK